MRTSKTCGALCFKTCTARCSTASCVGLSPRSNRHCVNCVAVAWGVCRCVVWARRGGRSKGRAVGQGTDTVIQDAATPKPDDDFKVASDSWAYRREVVREADRLSFLHHVNLDMVVQATFVKNAALAHVHNKRTHEVGAWARCWLGVMVCVAAAYVAARTRAMQVRWCRTPSTHGQ